MYDMVDKESCQSDIVRYQISKYCQAQPKSQPSWAELAVLWQIQPPPAATRHPSGFKGGYIYNILGVLSSREYTKDLKMKTTSKLRRPQHEDNLNMKTTSK